MRPGGFQVCQKADLFQHIRTEVLCLVNNKNRPSSLRMNLHQPTIQLVNQRFQAGRPRIVGNFQLIAHGGHQFQSGLLGIKDQGNFDPFRNLLKQASTQGRFSRPHLPRQEKKSTPVAHTVKKMCQGLPVPSAHEKKPGVRSQGERVFRKTKIGCVHILEAHHDFVPGKMKGRGLPDFGFPRAFGKPGILDFNS